MLFESTIDCGPTPSQRGVPQPGGGSAHLTDPQQVLPFPSAPPATGSIRARKPVGGFVFLTVVQFCLIWWAYHSSKRIEFLDLRVWFAAHELATNAKRCQLAPGQQPHYLVEELRKLLGWRSGDAPLRASIRRLEALGLLRWTASRITFATSPTDLQGVEDLSDFSAMLERITNNRRCIPVPRQTVRWIAQGGCRTIRLATLLGHLLRCLYYRDGRCVSGGRCKASWIATVFGVDRLQVKRERRRLLAIGLLQRQPGPPDPQWLLQRHGPVTYVSLTWTQAGLREASKCCSDVQEQPATPLPPPPSVTATPLPPPCLYQEPLQELGKEEQEDKHQKPAQTNPAPAAVSPPPEPPTSSPSTPGIEHDVEDNKAPVTISPPAPPHGGVRSSEGKAKVAITAHHFTCEQLEDTAYLVEVVFPGAVKAGLCHDHRHDLLQVLTLAEHALETAQDPTNPGAQFAANLRQPRWYGSEGNEATARARFKVYEDYRALQYRGQPTPPYRIDRQPSAALPPVASQPHLSALAQAVQAVQRQWERLGHSGEAFAYGQTLDPELTRATWDRGVQELAQARQVWTQAHALQRIGDLGRQEDGRASPCPEAVESCPACGEEGEACLCPEAADIT